MGNAVLAIILTFFTSIPTGFSQGLGDVNVISKDPAKPVPLCDLTISPGKAQATKLEPDVPLAVAQPLPDQRVIELLKRLTPLKPEATKLFKLPEQSLVKPQLPGTQTVEIFPQKPSVMVRPKPTVKNMPLKVLRVSPTGTVDRVTQLAVTFSQPMVAIEAAQVADPQTYLKLFPQPEGVWRWAGTQTILFDPKNKRFPKATNYTVTVPKTSASVAGAHLDTDQSWSISTPAVSVTKFLPEQGVLQVASPVMLALFNQDIDRQAILTHTQVMVGTAKYALQAVDDKLVETNKQYKQLIAGRPKTQWLALKPTSPLPLGRTAQVIFSPGCPSLEGPLTSTRKQQFSVDIHGPMAFRGLPGSGDSFWQSDLKHFQFTNEIDPIQFKASSVKITPALPAQKIGSFFASISIAGRFKPLTKYTVTIDGSLTDRFGQKLGRSEVVSFVTGPRFTDLRSDYQFATIPFGKAPIYTLWAQAMPHAKVTIYKTRAEDWAKFANPVWTTGAHPAIGKLAATKIFNVGPEYTAVDVDLTPYLSQGYGQFVVLAESQGTKKDQYRRTASWIQITAMGIDAFKGKQLNVLATTLADATPIKDVDITLLPSKVHALTDLAGLTKLPISSHSYSGQVLIAKKGQDTAILPSTESNWNFTAQGSGIIWYAVSDRGLYKPGEKVNVKGWARGIRIAENDALDLFDCKLHSVSYMLTDNWGTELKHGQATVDSSGGFAFDVILPEKTHLGYANITVKVPPAQSRHFPTKAIRQDDSATPESPGSNSTNVSINIQEFRRPEFEMKVTSSLGNTMILGDSTSLTATARYFGGDSLSNSPVDWNVNANTTNYSPAGWSEFSFGKQSPLWGLDLQRLNEQAQRKSISGLTDSAGINSIDLRLERFSEALPVTCSCEATVTDVNRQTWSDHVDILVHSANTYVGLKTSRPYYHKGEPIDLKVIATDIDGKVSVGKAIDVKLIKIIENEKIKEITKQSLTSEALPQSINFVVAEGGQYKVVATVYDANNHKNETTVFAWVEGDEPVAEKTTQIQKLIMMPDRNQYQPGDIAEIMINTPIYPAHGVVIIRRNTIVSTAPIAVQSTSQTLKVPITKDYYPNLSVEVYLTGKDFAFASGSLELKVPPRARALEVSAVAANPETVPGGDTSINIDLKDFAGRPVSAGEVAVVVADEALLALADYKWPDPIDLFYPTASASDDSTYLRSTVILPRDKKKTAILPLNALPGAPDQGALPMGGLAGRQVEHMYEKPNEVGQLADYGYKSRAMMPVALSPAGMPPPPPPSNIALRSNFSALALFEPAVTTDRNGKAQVKLHLPDSLTRYRIMAVAVSGADKFGSCESNVTARLPLTVKPSAPRFLNFGDHCQLPVVIQNQTDNTLKVEVVTRMLNAVLDQKTTDQTTSNQITSDQTTTDQAPHDKQQTAGKIVEVPARDRVEVRFPVTTMDEGKAQFQCAAVSGDLSDAAEFALPVCVPATTETFATYGQIDNGAVVQKLDRPHDVFEQVGGLSITTSSTAVQALTDAYFYLRDYTYECSEQLSSRVLAMLSLHDVFTAFDKLKGADEQQFKANIQKDLDKLLTRQNSNGDFGLWGAGEAERWPFISLQVAQALRLAKDKGYKIDAAKLDICQKYLTNIAKNIPKDYDKQTRVSLEARALNIRYQQKDIDAGAARQLIDRALKDKIAKLHDSNSNSLAGLTSDLVKSDLPLECAGWLLPVLSKDKDSKQELQLLRRLIDSQIKETASTASANEDSGGYGDWDYRMFYSHRRTDAIILEALIADQPDSELIAKFARGLLAHRKNGAWEGTQENGYVLQALGQYFAKYEKQTPNFQAQEWLGDTLVGLQKYAGRSTESKIVSIPTQYLLQHGADDILLDKVGPGRLYYRVGLDYAPRNLNLKPADFGFSVQRHYEAVDNKSDVRQDADGTWHIKSGATVRAKLHFSAPGARYHVALMDPLPAGAEPLNAELAGTRTAIPDKAEGGDAPVPEGDQQAPNGLPMFWWHPRWFEHQNLRDHQAEAFTSLLTAGRYDYSYLMRATTPGDYHVPPTKVEEMYAPETFGRAGTEHVIVE